MPPPSTAAAVEGTWPSHAPNLPAVTSPWGCDRGGDGGSGLHSIMPELGQSQTAITGPRPSQSPGRSPVPAQHPVTVRCPPWESPAPLTAQGGPHTADGGLACSPDCPQPLPTPGSHPHAWFWETSWNASRPHGGGQRIPQGQTAESCPSADGRGARVSHTRHSKPLGFGVFKSTPTAS